jgi:hypothetical protein
MDPNRDAVRFPRRRARIARAFAGISLVSGVLHVAACQSLVGIVDRHYERLSDAGSAPSAICIDYCDTVMAACLEPFAVYPSRNVCLGICRNLDEGDPTTKTGNTVACRAEQARLAKDSQEMDTYCPSAGPGGAGVCGADCDSYCTLYGKLCPDDASDKCVQKCGVLLDDGTFDAAKNGTGDTLQCRLVHTGNATLDPGTHCPHASLAPHGPTPCAIPTPNCTDYCRVVMGACTGSNAVYESPQQCKSVCAALDVGTSADLEEDTLGCRTYHSYNALDLGVTHCPHAGPGGDGHCGMENCPPYCRLLAAACGAAFPFTSPDACEADCLNLKGAAKDSHGTVATAKAGGDSVQCRLLHVARAFADQSECAKAISGAPCE